MAKFLLATVTAIVYIVFLFLEMRFIIKENKPLKLLLRDALLVYLSVLVGGFMLSQFVPLGEGLMGAPKVFTNEPDF